MNAKVIEITPSEESRQYINGIGHLRIELLEGSQLAVVTEPTVNGEELVCPCCTSPAIMLAIQGCAMALDAQGIVWFLNNKGLRSCVPQGKPGFLDCGEILQGKGMTTKEMLDQVRLLDLQGELSKMMGKLSPIYPD